MTNRAELNKLETAWVLARAKFMMQLRTLVTRLSSRSKFRAIRTRKKPNKTRTRTTKNKRMTLRWKATSMAKCTTGKT
jgi:hypothetical protein